MLISQPSENTHRFVLITSNHKQPDMVRLMHTTMHMTDCIRQKQVIITCWKMAWDTGALSLLRITHMMRFS